MQDKYYHRGKGLDLDKLDRKGQVGEYFSTHESGDDSYREKNWKEKWMKEKQRKQKHRRKGNDSDQSDNDSDVSDRNLSHLVLQELFQIKALLALTDSSTVIIHYDGSYPKECRKWQKTSINMPDLQYINLWQ